MTVNVYRRRGEERWRFDFAEPPYAPHELVKPHFSDSSAAVMQVIHTPDETDFVPVPVEKVARDGPHYCRLPDGSVHTATELVRLAESREHQDVYVIGIIL